MNPSKILVVPGKGSELRDNAEAARLFFAEVSEAASMAAPSVYRNLVKTGRGLGMTHAEARWKARKVSKQMFHVASLANEQMVAMRLYVINFDAGYMNYNKPKSSIKVDE